MKPDFDRMSKAELRAYIVAHTDDQEAFYKFVDRFAADTESRVWQPFSNTPQEVAKMEELIQEQIKMLEHQNDQQDK